MTTKRPLASVGDAAFYSDDDTLAIGDNLGGPIIPPDESFPIPLTDQKLAAIFQGEDDSLFAAMKAVRIFEAYACE